MKGERQIPIDLHSVKVDLPLLIPTPSLKLGSQKIVSYLSNADLSVHCTPCHHYTADRR